MHWIADPIQLDRRRFLTAFDGTTRRWGTRDLPKASFFDPDYGQQRFALVRPTGTILSGGSRSPCIPEHPWAKFEVEAKPTTNKLVIRMYQDAGGETWTLWTTLTAASEHVLLESDLARHLAGQASSYAWKHDVDQFATSTPGDTPPDADGRFTASGSSSSPTDERYPRQGTAKARRNPQPKILSGGVEVSMDWKPGGSPSSGFAAKREVEVDYDRPRQRSTASWTATAGI